MKSLKVCIVCFTTGGKLFNINNNSLKFFYNIVSGIKTEEKGFPSYLCYECKALVVRYKLFRDKCQKAFFVLQELKVAKMQITLSDIMSIDIIKLGLGPTLTSVNIGTSNFNFEWTNDNSVLSNDNNQDVCNTKDIETHNENLIANSDEYLDEEVVSTEEDKANIEKFDKITEEYAIITPISKNEAKAAFEIYNYFGSDKEHKCKICNKSFSKQLHFNSHLKRHEKHISGLLYCDICLCYYRTELLLNAHISDVHAYKYICRKCSDVNFKRSLAKKHYFEQHIENSRKISNTRPEWMPTKKQRIKTVQRKKSLPSDFFTSNPMTHEEQYSIIEDRKNSRNYLEAQFKCEFCFRGFRREQPFFNHMRKHSPESAGPLQCDICKIHVKNVRKMHHHMINFHIEKLSCNHCTFLTYSRPVALNHYRFHNKVSFQCQQCQANFFKMSSLLSHVRTKHPSSIVCNVCGHNFVSDHGLFLHMQRHTKQELEQQEGMVLDKTSPLFCKECDLQFLNDDAFQRHLRTSSKHVHSYTSLLFKDKLYVYEKKTEMPCKECGETIHNDRAMVKHYKDVHPFSALPKDYMCDICGHTTANQHYLKIHMDTHKNLRPFKCSFCDKAFRTKAFREKHHLIHTGEKPFKCSHCDRRFRQKGACKLHVQTVHMKIPYPAWNKANRRKKNKNAPNKMADQPMTFQVDSDKMAHQADYVNFLNNDL